MVETFSAGTTFLTDICLLRSSSDCGFTDILISKNADANCTVYGHKRQTSRVDIRPLRAFEGRESTAQNLERYVRIVRPQLLTLLRYCTHTRRRLIVMSCTHMYDRKDGKTVPQLKFYSSSAFQANRWWGTWQTGLPKAKSHPLFEIEFSSSLRSPLSYLLEHVTAAWKMSIDILTIHLVCNG